MHKDAVTAIKISRNFPILDNSTGKFLGNDFDEAGIFFKKDFVLLQMSYLFTIHKISDAGVMEVDKKELRKTYFIYKKGNTHGYFTDSSRNFYFNRMPVDSIREQFWPAQSFIEPLLDNFKYSLVDSLTRRSGRLYYNSYSFQNKKDSLQKGTFTLEFTDGLPFFDYSLSQRLETVQKMKLTGITIMNEARYVKEYNITIDAVTQNQKLTQLKDFNKAEIDPYFNYIESELQKNR